MEARIRNVGGGFPGYDGPALPRATRSTRQGRSGDTGKWQSKSLARTGVFELLATVAGQILQDTGVKEAAGSTQSQEEGLPQKLPSSIESQSAGVAKVKNITPVHKPESDGEIVDDVDGLTFVSTSYAEISIQGNKDVKNVSCIVQTPAQEDETYATVKDIPVDDVNSATVHVISSTPDDEVILPLCGSNMSITHAIHSPTSPSYDIKEVVSAPEESGGSTKVEACPNDNVYESVNINGMVSELAADVGKQAAMEMVEETPANKELGAVVLADDNTTDSSNGFIGLLEGFGAKMECSEALDDLKAGVEGPLQLLQDQVILTPESHMHCKISESGEFGESVELTDLTEVKGDEMASMEIEDKSTVVAVKVQPTGSTTSSFQVTTPGLAEGQSTRPMVKRVMSKMDGKFYKREYKHRSSQHLHPEIMKKTRDSYSRSLKVRKTSRVVKRTHVAGMKSKRQHAEMESTDSGSSEDSRYGTQSFFSGIAAYTRQRTTRGLPNKRKKIAEGSLKVVPELHLNTSDLMEMEYECVGGEPPAAAAKLRSAKAASVASSPTARSAKLSSKKSLEPHVKLSIKSFTVPELFVDLPESASVASLKRAVMDAAMNLLGGGLRVRVLMQGKKVPDEAASLTQIGISRNVKPESLGFMLEPSPVLSLTSATAEDPQLVLTRAVNQPAPRYPVYGVPGLSGVGDGGVRCSLKGRSNKSSGNVVDADPSYTPPSFSSDQEEYVDGSTAGAVIPDESLKGGSGMKSNNHLNERMAVSPHPTRVAAAGALAAIRAQADASRRARNEVESPSSAPTSSHDSLVAGSGAIILHPGLGTGDGVPGMALVPIRSKLSRALDNGKRRVRRPFSVSEVEALVHAVEKLGTGRWRDVKLRSFEHAKHRTYVDLKDKWKTLVHTARISPHQRRGEPVPQELLERVTHAHSYWTAHAAKQQADLDF